MTAEARSWVEDPSRDPMFGVALLKIAMRMKKNPELGREQIIADVVRAMGFSEDALRAYVERNLGLLVTTARSRGY